MIPFKILVGAIVLVPCVLPVATDFVPFKMDNRFELGAGAAANVGDKAGVEVGGCPWGGYKLWGITCNGGGGGARTDTECWKA
jgi:hypothetical protein